MEDAQRFGDRLKELRIRAHLTQRELAEKIGVDFSYLSKIENGVLPPPSDRLILRLAEIFHADKDGLFILAGRIPPDIAELLKNQKTLQLLRAERAKKKIVVKEAKKSGLMTRVPRPRIPVLNFKNLARVAVALVLVIAVGASLWYAAPHPVKAVDINVTNPSTGTLGKTYTFTVNVTVQSVDFLPVARIDVEIYYVNDPTNKKATLADLPLQTAAKLAHSVTAGSAEVKATEGNWWSWGQTTVVGRSGYGYKYLSGPMGTYNLGIGWGYGYGGGLNPPQGETSIKYTIYWTSPSGWPTGNYKIRPIVWGNDSTTPTQGFTVSTPATFKLSAAAAAPAAPTGGGGEPPPESKPKDVSNIVNDKGLFTEQVPIDSADGNVHVSIPKDTTGLIYGHPITEISITQVVGPPAPPENSNFIGITYDLEPSGATFDPAVTLTFNFNAAWLPENLDPESGLTIAYYDEATGTWVDLEATDIVVDMERGTITANIRHFTYFSVLARVAPAAFTVSDLSISPTEVEIAQKVNISATITNTGDLSGIHELTMKINGKAVSTKRLTLDRRASETVTFVTVQGATGTYAVDVEGLTGSFTVKTPPTKPVVIATPPAPAPTVPAPAPAPPAPAPSPTVPVPAPGVNIWLLIIIAVATVIVVGAVLWYFAFRRSS